MFRIVAAGLVAAAAAAVTPLAPAFAQPVQKTTVQEQPFPGPIDHTVMVRTLVAGGAEVAPHTHPGVEMAYVADGQALVSIAGRPDQKVAAGGSFSVPNHVVHSVRNTGGGPLTMISTYVVDRRKPIATPAPPPQIGPFRQLFGSSAALHPPPRSSTSSTLAIRRCCRTVSTFNEAVSAIACAVMTVV
ncbi:MAG: hypothetical protein JWQ97_2029 [Phenylobacterium sp.]|nr:hypothetical protein [Phenylobacterium sp.]